MADRTYDLLIDTPENRKIAETLRRYNNIKNTNGQPNYLWRVPHISGTSLKGGSCCSECKMTGGAMPNSVLLQMDERQTLQRPRGMVSPYTQPPAKYILSGNTPPYPQFNSTELDTLNNRKVGRGWGAVEGYNPDGTKMTKEQYEAYLKKPRPRPMYVGSDKPVFGRPDIKRRPDVMPTPVMPTPEIVLEGSGAFSALATQGLKQGAKTGAKYAVKGAKLAVAGAKQGAKIAVMVASNPIVQDVVKEIASDKDIQKAVIGQITTMIKGQATENVIEDAKDGELEGGRIKKGKSPRGKTDGRAKRAEIVKKVMKEKGLKMIEASKYVKANNLY
jgi:hypothetical protein